VKPKPAQENWYHVAICLHEFGQRLVAPRLQILEIFRVIGAEPHHHGKVADLGGVQAVALQIKSVILLSIPLIRNNATSHYLGFLFAMFACYNICKHRQPTYTFVIVLSSH